MTIDEALSGPFVGVVQRQDEDGIYLVRIGALATVVTIALRRTRGKFGRTAYTQSHAIKTPDQTGPYWTSIPEGDTPGTALHKSLTGLTSYYGKAVKNGHEPSESWLVPGRVKHAARP